MIKIRLKEIVAPKLGEYQAGFWKGRGTTDQIFYNERGHNNLLGV